MTQELSAVFENHHRSLLKVDEDEFLETTVSLVKEASERDITVIYVATKKPYVRLKDELEKQEVTMNSVHFVDCIIKTLTNRKVPEEENVLYLNRTDDLRNISTAISATANTRPGQNALLIIDSLEALLASHPTQHVARFLTDIQERLETTEMNLVLFDEGRIVEDEVGQEIYDVVDNVLFLRGRSE